MRGQGGGLCLPFRCGLSLLTGYPTLPGPPWEGLGPRQLPGSGAELVKVGERQAGMSAGAGGRAEGLIFLMTVTGISGVGTALNKKHPRSAPPPSGGDCVASVAGKAAEEAAAARENRSQLSGGLEPGPGGLGLSAGPGQAERWTKSWRRERNRPRASAERRGKPKGGWGCCRDWGAVVPRLPPGGSDFQPEETPAGPVALGSES